MVIPREWRPAVELPERDQLRRERELDGELGLGEFADPECRRCHGDGVTETGDPCPACIVDVWT